MFGMVPPSQFTIPSDESGSLFVLDLLHAFQAYRKASEQIDICEENVVARYGDLARVVRKCMKLPHEMRPGNRYAREAAGRTLGQLIRAKMALVAVCRQCRHRRLLFPTDLIDRYGEHFLAIELGRRLRCTSCGARTANLHETSR